jgi:hypothetical protein
MAARPGAARLMREGRGLDGMSAMRLTGRHFFDSVVKNPNQFFIIHYSSQSLYDGGREGITADNPYRGHAFRHEPDHE